jgi:hypothetical protein
MAETGFGVIGVGTWGELHAMVYASTPGARLVAVFDEGGGTPFDLRGDAHRSAKGRKIT